MTARTVSPVSSAGRKPVVVMLSAAAALITGCSIWSRGLVSANGGPVGGADVRVLEAENGALVGATRTDSNGCFFLSLKAPRGQRHFTLEIGASGFKPARLNFELETPVLLATLTADSSERPSEIRPATASERSDQWTPQCVPPMPPGAEQLSPH